MAVDSELITQFAGLITGSDGSASLPGNPGAQGAIIRIATVTSLDTVNGYASVNLSTSPNNNTPAAILGGVYPVVGSLVTVAIFGKSYFVLGTIGPASSFSAEMYRAAALTTSGGVFPFDTAASGSAYLTLGASAGYTVQVPGQYLVACALAFTPVSANRYFIELTVNGSAVRLINGAEPDGTATLPVGGVCTYPCNKGDLLQISFSCPASTAMAVSRVNCSVTFIRVSN